MPSGGASAAPGGGTAGEAREYASGSIRVHADAAGGVPATNGHPIGGVVVVAPSSMRMTDVIETAELLRVSGSPVVGVIAYDRPGRTGDADDRA